MFDVRLHARCYCTSVPLPALTTHHQLRSPRSATATGFTQLVHVVPRGTWRASALVPPRSGRYATRLLLYAGWDHTIPDRLPAYRGPFTDLDSTVTWLYLATLVTA